MLRLAWLCCFFVAANAFAADDIKSGIAVLDIQGNGIDPTLLPTLTEILTVEVDQLGLYKVIAGRDIEAMLGFEKQKDMIGCTDAACLAEIGGALGVERILATQIGKVGSTFVVNIKLINIRMADTEGRVYETVKGEQDTLIAMMHTSVVKLLGRDSKAAATIYGTAMPEAKPEPKAEIAKVEPKPETKAEPEPEAKPEPKSEPEAEPEKVAATEATTQVEKKVESGGGLPIFVPIGVTVLGVGAVVAGFAFAATAKDKESIAHPDMPGSQLNASAARSNAMLANVMFVAGGVVAAAGIVLFFFTGGSDDGAAAVTPMIVPGGAGLAVGGVF